MSTLGIRSGTVELVSAPSNTFSEESYLTGMMEGSAEKLKKVLISPEEPVGEKEGSLHTDDFPGAV